MTYRIQKIAREDGRESIEVLNESWPRGAFNPRRWTRVRNIDGSNRFMPDDGDWSFLNLDDRALRTAFHECMGLN